jgi:hypothetical protein
MIWYEIFLDLNFFIFATQPLSTMQSLIPKYTALYQGAHIWSYISSTVEDWQQLLALGLGVVRSTDTKSTFCPSSAHIKLISWKVSARS